MKKLPVLVICLIGLLSCNRVMNGNKDKLVTGSWNVYETVAFQNNDDSVATHCNACSLIVFAMDHSGYITTSGPRRFDIRWKIDEGKLTIQHSEESKDDVVDDGTYKIINNSVNGTHEITLYDSAKNTKYILRK